MTLRGCAILDPLRSIISRWSLGVVTVLLSRAKKGTERRGMTDRKTEKTVIGTRNIGNGDG